MLCLLKNSTNCVSGIIYKSAFLHLFQGFMTREERKKFENLNSSYNRYWVPCIWFTNLAAQARKEGRIRDNCALKLLMEVRLGIINLN